MHLSDAVLESVMVFRLGDTLYGSRGVTFLKGTNPPGN
jgi:hypothetical protein